MTIRTDNSAAIANLQAENERLRKALRFYGAKINWPKEDEEFGSGAFTKDRGAIARKALKEDGEDD